MDDLMVMPRRRTDAWGVVLCVGLALLFGGYFLQVLHRTRAGPDGGHFGDFRHFYFASRASGAGNFLVTVRSHSSRWLTLGVVRYASGQTK